MIVQLQCPCHWSSEKQDRIAALIAERTELLLGNSISPLVKDLVFVDNVQLSFQSALTFSLPGRKDIRLDKRSDNTYRLVLSSETLFSMVKPGAGQAHFDELISSAKKVICEVHCCSRA